MQNKIAIVYDFDGTLTPKTMQEYTIIPKLGIKSKSFWNSIQRESNSTGGELMMVYMRQLLEQANKKNILNNDWLSCFSKIIHINKNCCKIALKISL